MNAMRREYLQALELETWVLRRPTAAVAMPGLAAPAASRADDVTPADAELDWAALQDRVAVCTRCALATTRTQTVFGVGNPQAQWFIVGEAPGAEEDRQGEPFVGRAGQLLNAMLRAIGLGRSDVYIANVLKCRPPGNRDPAAGEAAHCVPYLERQIALVRPKLLLVVGRIAAQQVLASDAPLGSLRQKTHAFGPLRVPVVVTYHPAYLLRSPGEKRKAWEDLQYAREVAERV
jgi:DNA polymerase